MISELRSTTSAWRYEAPGFDVKERGVRISGTQRISKNPLLSGQLPGDGYGNNTGRQRSMQQFAATKPFTFPELDWSQPAPTGREARSHFARSQSTYPPMPARCSKPRTPPNVAITFRPRWTITRAAGTEQLRGAAPHAFGQQPSMCHGEQWPRSLVGVKGQRKPPETPNSAVRLTVKYSLATLEQENVLV